MAKAGYQVSTNADVLLTAATPRSVLGILAPAQFGVDLRGFEISFDGVAATDKPVRVEICYCTFVSNSTPGTNNTNETGNIVQVYGRSIVVGFSAMSAWTAEPTALTPAKILLLTPNGGTYEWDWTQGETFDSAVSQGYVIRCNAPTSNVNARASIRWERC